MDMEERANHPLQKILSLWCLIFPFWDELWLGFCYKHYHHNLIWKTETSLQVGVLENFEQLLTNNNLSSKIPQTQAKIRGMFGLSLEKTRNSTSTYEKTVGFFCGEIIGQTEGQPPSKSSLFSVGLILNSGLNLHFSVEHSDYFIFIFLKKLGRSRKGEGITRWRIEPSPTRWKSRYS